MLCTYDPSLASHVSVEFLEINGFRVAAEIIGTITSEVYAMNLHHGFPIFHKQIDIVKRPIEFSVSDWFI